MKIFKKNFVLLLMIILTSCGVTNNIELKEENTEKIYNAENEKSQDTKGLWKKDFYVDEFGDKTADAMIYNTSIEGTFSNSATTHSKCTFGISIDEEYVTLMMFEYGNLQVKGEDKYNCKLRANNGEEKNFVGKMSQGRVIFDSLGATSIINFLKENQKFKLYLEEETKYGTPSTYLCEI